jgi:hypothetical protein
MPTEIDWEKREKAEELYVYGGLTYPQVSGEIGISVNTLQKWGTRYNWVDRRKEYRSHLSDIRLYEVQAAKGLMERAARSLDPQDAYAAQRLAAGLLKRTETKPREQTQIDRPRAFLEDMEFIADYLKTHSPEGLKHFGHHFDGIVNEWKAEHEKKTGTQ